MLTQNKSAIYMNHVSANKYDISGDCGVKRKHQWYSDCQEETSLEGHTQSYVINYDTGSGSLMIIAVMRVMKGRNPI